MVAYFYVDNDKIYMMPHFEEYLTLFYEIDEFPPNQQQTDLWERNNPGNFFYNTLVCSEEAFGNVNELEKDGIHHRILKADGDLRSYSYYPETSGTQEYLYILWEKNNGILHFANWSGNFKNLVEFYTSSYEGSIILNE